MNKTIILNVEQKSIIKDVIIELLIGILGDHAYRDSVVPKKALKQTLDTCLNMKLVLHLGIIQKDEAHLVLNNTVAMASFLKYVSEHKDRDSNPFWNIAKAQYLKMKEFCEFLIVEFKIKQSFSELIKEVEDFSEVAKDCIEEIFADDSLNRDNVVDFINKKKGNGTVH